MTASSDDEYGPLLRKVLLAVQVNRKKQYSLLARSVFVELLLGRHNTNTGKCNPAAQTIGDDVGRDERNIRGAVNELIVGGDLQRKRRRAGSPSYSFPGLCDRMKSPGLDHSKSPAPDRSKSPARNTANRTEKAEPNICDQDLADVVEVENQDTLELAAFVDAHTEQQGDRGGGEPIDLTPHQGANKDRRARREKRPAASAKLPYVDAHTSSQKFRDRGHYEVQIAARLGKEGWELLQQLSDEMVNRLCQQQARGELSDAELFSIASPPRAAAGGSS